MTERSARVEQCIQEAECICESIEELPQVQVQVASRSVGLFGSSSDSDSSKSGTENDDQDENDVVEIPSAELGQLLMSSGFNWFSVVETVKGMEMLQNLSLRSITLWLSHLIVLKRRDFLSSPIRLFLQISVHDS